MDHTIVLAVLCILYMASASGQGDDELLLCKPARSMWKSSCPNTSSVAKPGKQGPKGERGSDGLRGPAGPPGVQNRSETQQQNQKIRELTDLVLGMISRQYHVDTTARTWSAARAYCKSIGADLVTHGLRNPIIRKYIINNVLRPLGTSHNYWIGLTDSAQEGSWMWVDGVVSTPENSIYYPGEPNNIGGGDADCAFIYGRYGSYGIDDNNCIRRRKGVMCEWNCPCSGN